MEGRKVPTTELGEVETPPAVDQFLAFSSPTGKFTATELGDDLHARLNATRKTAGLAPLQSFSPQDLVNDGATPQERDLALFQKLGVEKLTKDIIPTNQDILMLAEQRNIKTEGGKDAGFKSFISRATGSDGSLDTLTPVQRATAYKALADAPTLPNKQSLPVKSSSTRHSDEMLAKTMEAFQTKPVTVETVKQVTGITSDKDASNLLDDLVARGDVDKLTSEEFKIKQGNKVSKKTYDQKTANAEIARLNKLGKKATLETVQQTVYQTSPKEQ